MAVNANLKEGRIPSLNGWRAAAILLVILDHASFTSGFPLERLPFWCVGFFQQGDLGVRIFFVLSGFLITHLLLRETESTGAFSLKHFFLRRSLRILPVYCAYLIVVALLAAGGVYHGEIGAAWFGCLTFTRNLIGPLGGGLTAHFWSLAVEEQFYLVWPISVAACALWRRPRMAIGLLLVPIVVCPLIRLSGVTVEKETNLYERVLGGKSILVYADSLAIGCLGAFLTRLKSFKLTSDGAAILLTLALMIIAGGVVAGNIGGRTATVLLAFMPGLQAAAVMVAMWVSSHPQAGFAFRILNWPLIDRLGVLSYSLYIWHALFLFPPARFPLVAPLYDWRTWWLAAIATAALSYYGVERPVLRLKKKLKA